jgi:rod shape-determining protein MreD
MKILLYFALVLFLVPVQTTLLPHISVWGVKPDLGLVIAAVIGLVAGELEGLLVGLVIGWVLSLYSAGDVWLSVMTTGGAGLSAGFLGRQVAQVTPTILSIGLLLFSLAGGFIAVISLKHATISEALWMVQAVVLPQACFDAALGAGLVWLMGQRFAAERLGTFDRFS